MASNKSLAGAAHIQGGHYSCSHDPPPAFWEIEPAQTFWVNEDFSTLGGDWSAGGCWGRSLNQNYVKLNATSTISWATLWSVVDSWRYFGNGLMFAFEPWSGNYTVPPAIWTSAHVTQFAEPGWRYLAGTGSGLLPSGGSWSAMVPPKKEGENENKSEHASSTPYGARATVRAASLDAGDFMLVVEKLEGACLRCKVPTTSGETVSFVLAGPLNPSSSQTAPLALATWVTNSSVSFLRLADTPVAADGSFTIFIPRDHMYTFTTTTGQAKGHAASCSVDSPTMCNGVYAPHPFPYSDSYDHGVVGRFATYHSDNGGAFEVRKDSAVAGSDGSGGGHLLQASPRFPKGTEW